MFCDYNYMFMFLFMFILLFAYFEGYGSTAAIFQVSFFTGSVIKS